MLRMFTIRPMNSSRATTETKMLSLTIHSQMEKFLTSENQSWNIVGLLIVAQHPQVNGVEINHQNGQRVLQNVERADDFGT